MRKFVVLGLVLGWNLLSAPLDVPVWKEWEEPRFTKEGYRFCCGNSYYSLWCRRNNVRCFDSQGKWVFANRCEQYLRCYSGNYDANGCCD